MSFEIRPITEDELEPFIEVASTTTSGGKYGYAPLFYVPDTDPESRTGQTINFFVNGWLVA